MKSLTEEQIRMRELMGFTYTQNSHDILSEYNIKKALIGEQDNVIGGENEESTTTTLDKKEMYAQLKGMPATNENIKDAMQSAIGTYNDPAVIDKNSFSALWGLWPNVGSALINREKLKDMWNYYDKAGALNLDLINNGPTIPTVNGAVVAKNEKGVWVASSSVEEFLKTFNNFNLLQWSKNKKYFQLGTTQQKQIIFASSIIYPNRPGDPLRGESFYEKAQWKWEIDGKKYAADFLFGNVGPDMWVKDQEGGDKIIQTLAKVVDLQKLMKAPLDKSSKKPINFISYIPVSDVIEETGSLLMGYTIGQEGVDKTKNIVKDKTDTTTELITIDDYVGQPTEKGLRFDTQKYDLKPDLIAWIDNEINNLESYINTQTGKGNVSLNMGPITILSSASNTWGKGEKQRTLKATPPTTAKPNAGSSYEALNNTLAYNRGKAMIDEFKKRLDNAKKEGRFSNVNFDDEMVVQWQIADTGGKTDDDPSRGNIPFGQWVKISVGGSGKGKKEITTVTPGATITVGKTSTSIVRYRYSKSPGLMVAHPNEKGAKIINSIAGFLGFTRTKSTKANYATQHGGQE